MALTKDDIDAVAINLLVDGIHTFQVYLTRGGLTQRKGSSDRVDANAVLIKAATDYFEPFMATVPEALLQGESAAVEDPGRDGPRHEWRFEFGGGMNTLVYDIAYHAHSAGLPDEFADMVVQAERLTHSWYLAGVAEEMGMPLPSPAAAVAPPAPKPATASRAAPSARRPGTASKAPSAARPTKATAAKPGQLAPVPRERMGLAVFLDMLALSVPYAFLGFVFFRNSPTGGPPGAGLVLFAIAEFVLLMILRRSIGCWVLGIQLPPHGKPVYDPSVVARESKATLAFGLILCLLGVSGLTSWVLYRTPVPFFGFGFALWLSVPLVLLGSAAAVLAGGLVLQRDPRGVWLGGGVSLLALVAAAAAWGQWPAFADAAEAAVSAREGRPAGLGLSGIVADLVPILVLVVPAALIYGAYESWRRLGKGPIAMPRPAASRG